MRNRFRSLLTVTLAVGGSLVIGVTSPGSASAGSVASSPTPELLESTSFVSSVVVNPVYTAGSKISVGEGNICVRLESGDGMACAGDNAKGQLGDNTQNPRSYLSNITEPAASDSSYMNFRNIFYGASGANHSCFVTSSSAPDPSVVYCFGNNDYGQLGDWTTSTSLNPKKVADNPVTGFTNSGIRDVFAGYNQTCVTKSGTGIGNELWCWGENTDGQLGDGTTTNQIRAVKVGGVIGQHGTLSGAVIGKSHACAISAGSGYPMVCWGDNSSGQLGDGTTVDSLVPVDTGLSGTQRVEGMAAGDDFSCGFGKVGASSTDELWCWGANDRAQLGAGSTGSAVSSPQVVPSVSRPSPSVSFSTSGVVQVTAGGKTACAQELQGSDYFVHCWGANDGGQADPSNAGVGNNVLTPTALADNSQVGFDNGVPASTADIRYMGVSTSIVKGFACYGSFCWGDNSWGQLAQDDTNAYSVPVKIKVGQATGGGGGGGGGGGNYTPPPPVSPAPTFSVGQSNGALVVCVAMNDSPATFLSASVLSTQSGPPSNGDLLSSTNAQRTLTGIADAADAFPRAEEWDGADLAIVFDQHRMLVWNDDYQSEDEMVYEFQDWQVGTEYRVSLYASQVENSFLESRIAESMLDPVTYTFAATDTDCGIEPPAGTGSSSSTTTTTAPATTTIAAPTNVPTLVTSSNQELLSSSAGSAKILINGELVDVELVQASEELRRTVGGARTFEQVRALQALAAQMVTAVQGVLGDGVELPITVTNVDTGATISGLVTDPVTGDVLPVPVEDVLLILNENLVLMVGGADGTNNPANIAFDGVLEFGEGGYVAVLAYGLTPGAAGEVVVMSTPQLLDTFTVGTDGGVAAQAAIPADLAAGEHTVVVAVDGQSASLGFRVLSAGTLPVTGGSSSLPSALALLLAAAGAFGVLVVSRRRHTA